MTAFATVNDFQAVAPSHDFGWAELAQDARFQTGPGVISNAADATTAAIFATFGKTASEVADGAALREWLLSGGFATVKLPLFPEALFEGYRDLAMAILSVLPGAELVFPEAKGQPGLNKAARLWAANPPAAEIEAPRNVSRLETEMLACLADRDTPEDPDRIEARLNHIRRQASAPDSAARIEDAKGHTREAQVLRRGAIAANAVIPGAAARCGDGINLGQGYVLRRWRDHGMTCEALGSAALGFHLARTSQEDAPCDASRVDLPGEVQLDPTRGAVLKHEPVHGLFVAADGQVRVAMGALRVAGHGDKHLYVISETDAAFGETLFCFNESWQFLGMSVESFADAAPTGKDVMAILTPTAIWDDLVARADLGCGSSADALATLAVRKRSDSTQKTANQRSNMSLA